MVVSLVLRLFRTNTLLFVTPRESFNLLSASIIGALAIGKDTYILPARHHSTTYQ